MKKNKIDLICNKITKHMDTINHPAFLELLKIYKHNTRNCVRVPNLIPPKGKDRDEFFSLFGLYIKAAFEKEDYKKASKIKKEINKIPYFRNNKVLVGKLTVYHGGSNNALDNHNNRGSVMSTYPVPTGSIDFCGKTYKYDWGSNGKINESFYLSYVLSDIMNMKDLTEEPSNIFEFLMNELIFALFLGVMYAPFYVVLWFTSMGSLQDFLLAVLCLNLIFTPPLLYFNLDISEIESSDKKSPEERLKEDLNLKYFIDKDKNGTTNKKKAY